MKSTQFITAIVVALGILCWSAENVSALECGDQAQLLLPVNNAQGVSTTPALAIGVQQTLLGNCTLNEVRWQIATDANFNNIVYDTGFVSDPPHNVHNVPANQLSFSTTYYWRVQLDLTVDDGPPTIPAQIRPGWTSSRQFTTENIIIQLQCNWAGVRHSSPDDNSTVDTLTPTLSIEFFGAVQQPVCQHVSTDWEIATSINNLQNGVLVYSSPENTISKTSLALVNAANINDNTTYYWRVRLRGPSGETSDWSEPTSFHIQTFGVVGVPQCSWFQFENNSPADSADNVELNPIFEIHIPPNQAVQAPACEHQSTHWQVATDNQFNNVILDYPRDRAQWWPGVHRIPRTELPIRFDDFGNSPLSEGTTYYWRAKLEGQGENETDWSSATSFTTLGQNNGNGNGNQQPPPNNAGDLCDLDNNQNGVLDDPEFFNAVDMWITEAIDNPLFFGAVDAWIGQSDICATASDAASALFAQQQLVTARMSAQGLTLTALKRDIVSMSVEFFDLRGNSIYRERSSGGTLNWNMRRADGVPVANGIYLYRVLIVNAAGQVTASPIEKLIVIR